MSTSSSFLKVLYHLMIPHISRLYFSAATFLNIFWY